MSGSGTTMPRLIGLGGAAWGLTLLLRRDEIWTAVDGHTPDADEELVTSILGARHVLQGVAQLVAPRLTRVPVIAVDVIHAGTMVWFARRYSEHAKPALVSGVVALTSAALTATARAAAASGRAGS